MNYFNNILNTIERRHAQKNFPISINNVYWVYSVDRICEDQFLDINKVNVTPYLFDSKSYSITNLLTEKKQALTDEEKAKHTFQSQEQVLSYILSKDAFKKNNQVIKNNFDFVDELGCKANGDFKYTPTLTDKLSLKRWWEETKENKTIPQLDLAKKSKVAARIIMNFENSNFYELNTKKEKAQER